MWRRHIEQLREVGDTPVEEPPNQSTDQQPIDEETFPITSEASSTTQPPDEQLNPSESSSQTVTNQPTSVPHRYPKRFRRPPIRYRT